MRTFAAATAGIALVLGGCGKREAATASPVEIEEVVRTTAPPIDSLTREIARDLVPIEMLCPADEPPETWRPEPETIQQYQRARLIVANGATYELWATNAPLPRSRLVFSAEAIEGELLIVTGETHSHGPEGEHAHDVTDGHTWIDPINARAQARAIADALTSAFPNHAASFASNLAELESVLDAMHDRLQSLDTAEVAIIAPERPLGYIARRYEWIAGTIAADPQGLASDVAALLAAVGVTERLGGRQRAVLLTTVMPDEATTASLFELHGVRAVQWDSGEQPGDRSYLDILGENVARLEAALDDMGR